MPASYAADVAGTRARASLVLVRRTVPAGPQEAASQKVSRQETAKRKNWLGENRGQISLRENTCRTSEEDKRATTNVQNGLVFFFLFSFVIFSSLLTKTVVKPLNSKKKSWRKNSEKL